MTDIRASPLNKRARDDFTNSRLSSSLPNLNTIIEDRNRGPKKISPFIIGVAGGTASGKTSVCHQIVEELGIARRRVAIISQDCFYKPLNHEQLASVAEYNFDHPDAFDWELLTATLKDLSEGKRVKIPEYDFVTHSRKKDCGTEINAIDIILFEGILAFFQSSVRAYMDMKLFVDTDDDTRLSRRIVRDIRERGRDLEGILHQYQKFVKPAFDEYILPTKKYADVIIPRGADNHVAINLIVQHIRIRLGEHTGYTPEEPKFVMSQVKQVKERQRSKDDNELMIEPGSPLNGHVPETQFNMEP